MAPIPMTLLTTRFSRFAVGAASALLFITTPELPAKAQDTWRPFTPTEVAKSWCMLRKIGHPSDKAWLDAIRWHGAMDPEGFRHAYERRPLSSEVQAKAAYAICPGHFTDSY